MSTNLMTILWQLNTIGCHIFVDICIFNRQLSGSTHRKCAIFTDSMLHKYKVILVRWSNIQHCSTEYMQFIQLLCMRHTMPINYNCIEYWLAYIQSRLFYNFKIKANEAGSFSTRNCPLWSGRLLNSCEIQIIKLKAGKKYQDEIGKEKL